MSIITVIGSGLMGSAMSIPAADNGHQVRLVGTPLDREIIRSLQEKGVHTTLPCAMPEGICAFQFEDVREALEGADLVICGVSSFGVDWFAEKALPLLPAGVPALNVTKGLLGHHDGSLETFPHFFARMRPDISFAAIGGPCTAYELGDRRQTLVCYCSEDLAVAKFARDLLKTSYYHIVPTTDVIGVECSVALKNAYAMGVSLAIGMSEVENEQQADKMSVENSLISGAHDGKLHYNPQAALFAQSCIEMRRIVRLLGGNGDLAGGIPGAGDLYVTIFGGRTRRLGTLLGRGLPYTEVKKRLAGVTLEAVSVTTRVAEALRIRAKREEVSLEKFPLLMHLDALINQEAPLALAWENFGESGMQE
ncbi:MAG: glycerol-3-phosphate dehydrogenase [Oligosphaeraceae bacterium]|nr:glycerol-3-phosphate dehydrogenase [Oligosphaeraceae bacterium]